MAAPATAPASGCSPHSSSSVKSLPPPCPKSPPDYPDLYGKRRELAKVQMLEREINFLEEELKFVQSLQPASQCCKEVSDFVVGNPDPLIPTNRKNRRSCRFWKWLCGIPCFNFSWICCCCCCSGFSCRCPKLPRCCVSNPCPRTSSCCSSRRCDGCCNCSSCLPPPPNNWPCCCFSSAAASCGCRFPSFNCCICENCRKVSSGGGSGEKNNSCCCPDLSSCCCAFKFPSFSCCSKNGCCCGGGGGEKNNSCCTWKWCCCPKVRRPRCCKCTKNQCNCCSNPCCCCPSF